MQRSKINEYCEFPEGLNMLPYTRRFLKKEEGQKDDTNQEILRNELPEYPPEYYQYTLRGTVTHMGTSVSGHYYSLIRDNADNWFEFNDKIVKPFDIKDLSQHAFGGEEKPNSYLLFYERDTYFDENGKKMPFMSRGENMPAKLLRVISEENYKFYITRYIWSQDYQEYVFKLLEQINQKKDLAHPSYETLETAKFCTLYFMIVQLRSRQRMRIPKFLKELKSVLKASPTLCTWFISCFVYPETLKEFLVDCPALDMKYFVVGLIKIALNNAYLECEGCSQSEFEQTILCRLIVSVINTIYEQKGQVKQLDKIFDVLAHFSSLGVTAKIYLIRKKMVGRIIYYIRDDNIPLDYKECTEEFPLELPEGISGLGKSAERVEASELGKSISDKNLKNMLDKGEKNYNSLIETLANLIQSIKIANGDDKQQNYVPVELGEDEKQLVVTDCNVVMLLLAYAISKRAKKMMASLVAHILYKREDFSQQVIQRLEKELRDQDDQQLKAYVICLEKIMLIQDEFQKMRVTLGMNVPVSVIKDNCQYYRATEVCLDYLFKLCSRNLWALRLCSDNKLFLKFMETWLRENSNPYNGLSSGNLKLFKKIKYQIVEETLIQNEAKFTLKSQERLARLDKIYKNESEELASEYDSDEDYSDHIYQVGEKLDYCREIAGDWIPAVVNV